MKQENVGRLIPGQEVLSNRSVCIVVKVTKTVESVFVTVRDKVYAVDSECAPCKVYATDYKTGEVL